MEVLVECLGPDAKRREWVVREIGDSLKSENRMLSLRLITVQKGWAIFPACFIPCNCIRGKQQAWGYQVFVLSPAKRKEWKIKTTEHRGCGRSERRT